MDGGSGTRRSLDTPQRDRSRSRHSQLSARQRSRTRSRSRSRRLLKRDLSREQKQVRRREIDLQQERDIEQRRRSERRGTPEAGTSRERSRRGLPGSRNRKDRGTTSVDHHTKRSCSPTFSSRDLIQIIQSIKDVLPSQSQNQSTAPNNRNLDHKNMIPEFNPSEKNQRIDIWLKKVNECAKVYDWDEKTVVHFAMQKLTGLGKTWYESLNTILFTWAEWQVKLMNAFPSEQNYGQTLEDMLNRKSRPDESIEIYYYEKLALLNQCEITDKRAVDCIIHGIGDRTMRSSALALRCEQPDQLLKFLLSNNKELSTQQAPFRDRDINEVDDKQNNKTSSKGNPNLYCYNCKDKGHPYSRCPKPLIKCSHCNKVGHKPEACRHKQDTEPTKADPVARIMRISSSTPNEKFVKTVNVNGFLLEAFVDLGSEVTLMRQSDFSDLGLSHDSTPSTMKGFGNSLVQSVGSAKLKVIIDGVAATVSCRIVDDHLLDKPMLVGQSYSEQPHIVVYKDANKLQFLHIRIELPDLCEHGEHLERVRIIGFSRIYGTASIRAKTETLFTGSVVVDTRIVGKPNKQFLINGGVYEVKHGSLFVTVKPCSVPCCLQDDFVFARAEKVQVVNSLENTELPISDQQTKVPSTKRFDGSQIRVGATVSNSDRAKLIELLRRHEECFAYDLDNLRLH